MGFFDGSLQQNLDFSVMISTESAFWKDEIFTKKHLSSKRNSLENQPSCNVHLTLSLSTFKNPACHSLLPFKKNGYEFSEIPNMFFDVGGCRNLHGCHSETV